jgi:hypothetical protein
MDRQRCRYPGNRYSFCDHKTIRRGVAIAFIVTYATLTTLAVRRCRRACRRRAPAAGDRS